MTRLEIAELAQRVLAGPARCGDTRLVCVDGPSGSGKSTLAARLAAALGDPPLVHMDDLFPGWDGLAAAVPLLTEQVVAPLAPRARDKNITLSSHVAADVPPHLIGCCSGPKRPECGW